MTSSLRTMAAVAATAAVLLLAGCAGESGEATSPISSGVCADDTGVTLVVDSSALDDGALEEFCVTTEEPIAAADVLDIAEITTEGTEEYGDQVVCRVNNVPAEDLALTAEDGSDYFEECASMPAAFAYWSLWVKPVEGEWAYAEEGLATLQLEPGESLALLFTLNGEPATPSS